MSIARFKDAPLKKSGDGNGTMLVLGKEIGTRNCDAIIITKEPGVKIKPMPLHYHPKREEIFIIMEGKAKGVLNEKEIALEPGMVIILSPGKKHYSHLRAQPLGDKPLKMVEVGSPIEDETILCQ